MHRLVSWPASLHKSGETEAEAASQAGVERTCSTIPPWFFHILKLLADGYRMSPYLSVGQTARGKTTENEVLCAQFFICKTELRKLAIATSQWHYEA